MKQTVTQARVDKACRVTFSQPTQAGRIGRVVLLTQATQPLVTARRALRVA